MNTSIILGSVLISAHLTACGVGGARPEASAPAAVTEEVQADAPPAGDPQSTTLAADLQFLREEEKLARDVYLILFDKWHLVPHGNISASEQTHMDRVRSTLWAFSVPDPVQDDAIGAFVNTQLAGLYRDLVALGLSSDVSSLTVGATIEDLDLRDLKQMKSRTQDPMVLSMYAALECGSRNHLRAFTSQLAMRGVIYQPQYLAQAEYDAVLGGAHERCGRKYGRSRPG